MSKKNRYVFAIAQRKMDLKIWKSTLWFLYSSPSWTWNHVIHLSHDSFPRCLRCFDEVCLRLSTGSTVIVWYHFLNFLPAFFYSLSLPLYFAFDQYFLSHSPCISESMKTESGHWACIIKFRCLPLWVIDNLCTLGWLPADPISFATYLT